MLPYLIALIAVVTAAAAVLLRRMVKRVREQERLVARNVIGARDDARKISEIDRAMQILKINESNDTE